MVVPKGAEDKKNVVKEGAEGESIVVVTEQGPGDKTIVVQKSA